MSLLDSFSASCFIFCVEESYCLAIFVVWNSWYLVKNAVCVFSWISAGFLNIGVSFLPLDLCLICWVWKWVGVCNRISVWSDSVRWLMIYGSSSVWFVTLNDLFWNKPSGASLILILVGLVWLSQPSFFFPWKVGEMGYYYYFILARNRVDWKHVVFSFYDL